MTSSGGGFVCEFRPQLLVTSDRGLAFRKLMFASSDRTWTPWGSEALTLAFDLPLVAADGLEPVTAVISEGDQAELRPAECGPE